MNYTSTDLSLLGRRKKFMFADRDLGVHGHYFLSPELSSFLNSLLSLMSLATFLLSFRKISLTLLLSSIELLAVFSAIRLLES